MDSSGGEEEHVTLSYFIASEDVYDGVVIHLFLIFLGSDLVSQAAEELGSLVGPDHIPHLGFAFQAGFDPGGQLVGRMDLDREVLLGVNELDKEWELRSVLGGNFLACKFGPMVFHQVSQ